MQWAFLLYKKGPKYRIVHILRVFVRIHIKISDGVMLLKISFKVLLAQILIYALPIGIYILDRNSEGKVSLVIILRHTIYDI